MSDIAIRVENLCKVYRLGTDQARHETLFGAVTSFFKSPLLNYRNLRKLSKFDDVSLADGRAGIGDTASRNSGSPVPISSSPSDVIWALKDVSFDVKRGEALGIIGLNGAGKSTLLKILSRVTEPTSGCAQIHGRVASLLEVGTGFHPDLTGRENVYLNGTILGMKKKEIDRKFDEIAAFSGVEKFLDTPVKRYSSGMRVRLAFAVAAHLDPEILIVDEVLAVGDAAFQQRCLGKMSEVTSGGRTVLFVSHNMGALTKLCPTCLCLEGGMLVDRGESERVVKDYLDRTTAQIAGNGFADLTDLRRPDALHSRHSQLEWVRTLTEEGRQTDSYLEGKSITVEVAFSLGKSVSVVQLGCGVKTCEAQVELFTAPSPEYRSEWQPGHYRCTMMITPNCLREGTYALFLKMFADGVRQDTIADVLRFSITRCHQEGDMASYSQRWVAGPIRVQYPWNPPASSQPPSDLGFQRLAADIDAV